MQIGAVTLENAVISAPMAGVSDRPYRQIVREMGAGLAVSEMLTSQANLRHTDKSQYRMDIADEQAPISLQLVGTDPQKMADAARFNADQGADIIDINMGCPAKKVCKKLAGSALLGDLELVERILTAVVDAVSVPVTLKIRTGLAPDNRNATNVAQLAQDCGIQALAIHGRTRQCKFVGAVEYDSIAAVKQAVAIPVIANGDIDSPQKAAQILHHTGADGVMIGRAAQGQPWLFQQIVHYLKTAQLLDEPDWSVKKQLILRHVRAIHAFYGEATGVKFARKHIAWYLDKLSGDFKQQRSLINQQATADAQLDALQHTFLEIDQSQRLVGDQSNNLTSYAA